MVTSVFDGNHKTGVIGLLASFTSMCSLLDIVVICIRSRGSVVKAMGLAPASLGSAPAGTHTGTHMSHW